MQLPLPVCLEMAWSCVSGGDGGRGHSSSWTRALPGQVPGQGVPHWERGAAVWGQGCPAARGTVGADGPKDVSSRRFGKAAPQVPRISI